MDATTTVVPPITTPVVPTTTVAPPIDPTVSPTTVVPSTTTVVPPTTVTPSTTPVVPSTTVVPSTSGLPGAGPTPTTGLTPSTGTTPSTSLPPSIAHNDDGENDDDQGDGDHQGQHDGHHADGGLNDGSVHTAALPGTAPTPPATVNFVFEDPSQNMSLAAKEIAQQEQAAATATSQTGPTLLTGHDPAQDEVQCAYIAFYGRPADADGEKYWAQQLKQSGGDLQSMINAFGSSDEAKALNSGSDATQMVKNIYQHEFNHDADDSGLQYWVGQINSGKISLASAALAIMNGASGTDKTAIDNKLVVASSYTNTLAADPNASQMYSGSTAAANARSFLSAVGTNTTAATNLAGAATNVAHDIQGNISNDLVQAVGVSPTTVDPHHV